MPRFFLPPEAFSEKTVTLSGDAYRHIARSLRMAVGDEVTLSDGEGWEYRARLSSFSDESVTAEILSSAVGAGEPPIALTLYQGNPKGDKLELIVQKAVELGAFAIVPFESSRCVARVRADRAERQTARLSRIAEEAAAQCGRARIPRVALPLSFTDALRKAKECSDAILFCYEDERTRSLRTAVEETAARGARSLAVFVGSEGGFSPEEAALAAAHGALSVSLGRRILRCETAPLYALSSIACLLDF